MPGRAWQKKGPFSFRFLCPVSSAGSAKDRCPQNRHSTQYFWTPPPVFGPKWLFGPTGVHYFFTSSRFRGHLSGNGGWKCGRADFKAIFGEGLIIGAGPSPGIRAPTAVRGPFHGEGVGAKIRPSPKTGACRAGALICWTGSQWFGGAYRAGALQKAGGSLSRAGHFSDPNGTKLPTPRGGRQAPKAGGDEEWWENGRIVEKNVRDWKKMENYCYLCVCV